MTRFFYLCCFILPCLAACYETGAKVALAASPKSDSLIALESRLSAEQKLRDSLLEASRLDSLARLELLASHDSTWADLRLLMPDALFEIRYAGLDNFMKVQVYPCEACYLRLKVAKALLEADKKLKAKNLRFKFFDCYRPARAQHALWKVTPDARYVTPPQRGSMHSRGMAVDLTLCDAQGKDLDMGTPFDFFGQQAYWAYTPKHKPEVQANRAILRSSLEAVGFKTVTTEWWHFNFSLAKFNLSDWQWDCPN